MNVELPLKAVMDDPENIKMFRHETVIEILRHLVNQGSIDTCIRAIGNIPIKHLDYTKIVDKPHHLSSLLDEMVSQGNPLPHLCSSTVGRFGGLKYLFQKHRSFFFTQMWLEFVRENQYWQKLICFELEHRDTLRAWETIKAGFNGFSDDKGVRLFCLEASCARPAIQNLHDLMIKKGQLEPPEKTNLPERVAYSVKERGLSKKDRFGRVRKARTYRKMGDAPGLAIAKKFLEFKNGAMVIDHTGQMVLAITSYFSQKKKGS